MTADPRHNELIDLAFAVCDGEATDEQIRRIEDIVSADPAARLLYLQCLEIHFEMDRRVLGLGIRDSEILGPQSRVSSPEPPIPPIILDLSTPLPSPLTTSHYPLTTNFVGSPVFSYMVATVILGVMLLSAWAYKITHYQQMVVAPFQSAPSNRASELVFVGLITGMRECRWADPQTETFVGSSVFLGRKYALASGLMEITYNTGAKVILEGPCTYQVESRAGGYLSLGKLTAKVVSGQWPVASAKPQAANPKSPNLQITKSPNLQIPSSFILHPSSFVVKTPTAIITDLGTEFGVEVSKEGDTTSHVFRGSVKMETVAGGGSRKNVVLKENETARVVKGESGPRLVLKPNAANTGARPKFVRRLVEPPKALDLLDIVAGGNGTGRLRERGIDPVSGRNVLSPVNKSRRGDGQYWPVFWNRLIDGTFVPREGAGPVQLNSAGDTFDEYQGSVGRTFGNIWARAADADPNKQVEGERPWLYTIGHGERFMPGGRGMLGLHPNAGITFNLKAVRDLFFGSRPERFQAIAGLADSTYVAPLSDGVVDFRVFVDGRLTWKRIGLSRRDGTIKVDVELAPADRFLTLMATDGGDGLISDWFVLGEPLLKMTPINKEETKPMKH